MSFITGGNFMVCIHIAIYPEIPMKWSCVSNTIYKVANSYIFSFVVKHGIKTFIILKSWLCYNIMYYVWSEHRRPNMIWPWHEKKPSMAERSGHKCSLFCSRNYYLNLAYRISLNWQMNEKDVILFTSEGDEALWLGKFVIIKAES